MLKKQLPKMHLRNCTYLPAISQSEYKSILKVVHVGLFSLAKNHSVHNFPGKLLGYMANKLPILGSVNEGNDLMQVLIGAKAGYVHVNGYDAELLQSAIKLATEEKLRNELGENGHSLLEKTFSTQSAVENILLRLK